MGLKNRLTRQLEQDHLTLSRLAFKHLSTAAEASNYGITSNQSHRCRSPKSTASTAAFTDLLYQWFAFASLTQSPSLFKLRSPHKLNLRLRKRGNKATL